MRMTFTKKGVKIEIPKFFVVKTNTKSKAGKQIINKIIERNVVK